MDTQKIQVTKPVTFSEYRDSNGNTFLLPSSSAGDSIKLIRAMQESQFMDQARDLNKSGPVKIDLQTGQITHGLDGKPLTAPGDVDRRKEALDAIKAQIPNFDPATNPAHAKMEIINNFYKDKNGVSHSEVNGIKIDFANWEHKVDPSLSVLKADGTNWMKLADIAKGQQIESFTINSVLRMDGSSHQGGYSLDIGSFVKDGTRYDLSYINLSDFKQGEVPKANPTVREFLSAVSGQLTNSFSYNPYYMVDSQGNSIPNFFTAVPEVEWSNGKSWDELNGDQRRDFSKAMRDLAIQYSKENQITEIQLSDDNIKQMWNHRHHLHITEMNR